MKYKDNKQFMTDNGHYWFRPKYSKFVRIGQYNKETKSITAVGIVRPFEIKECVILSDIILRETTKLN